MTTDTAIGGGDRTAGRREVLGGFLLLLLCGAQGTQLYEARAAGFVTGEATTREAAESLAQSRVEPAIQHAIALQKQALERRFGWTIFEHEITSQSAVIDDQLSGWLPGNVTYRAYIRWDYVITYHYF